MKLTITFTIGDRDIDISVDSSQHLGTTLRILQDYMTDFPSDDMIEDIRLSGRMRRIYRDKTYEESDINTGDIIYILLKDDEKTTENCKEDDYTPYTVVYAEPLTEQVDMVNIHAHSEGEYAILTLRRLGLLECYIKDGGEDKITFTYDVYGKNEMKDIHAESQEHKYAFLINFGRILNLLDEYNIPINEENIYYDRNFIPYFKFRDIKTASTVDKLQIYRSVIAAVLGNKNKAEDYVEGGIETIARYKWFKDYMAVQDIYELQKLLMDKETEYLTEQKTRHISVPKVWNNIRNTLLIAMVFVLIIWGIIFFIRWYPQMRNNACLAKGQQAFIRREYIGCIDAMSSLDIDDMNYDSKYILAVSYARTENLSHDEITGIVERLSLTSSEKEYDYWINLGRDAYMEAESDAKFLVDDRLLAYAYMKEYNHLEYDDSTTGEEKESRMNELKAAIENMAKEYESKEEE